LLPPGAGFYALDSRICASNSLAFALCGRPLAFVREVLSLVGQLFATIRDSLPLIGDVISSGSREFTSSYLGLTLREGPLTLVKRFRPGSGRPRVSTVLRDHTSP